jgi:hypothetical protein
MRSRRFSSRKPSHEDKRSIISALTDRIFAGDEVEPARLFRQTNDAAGTTQAPK